MLDKETPGSRFIVNPAFPLQGVEKQVSGRQPRRATFWKTQSRHRRDEQPIYKMARNAGSRPETQFFTGQYSP
jgi:hypothetical protein